MIDEGQPMDARSHFHGELGELEATILDIADRCDRLVGMAVEALIEGDSDLADQVIEGDVGIDQSHLDVQSRWLNLMARQQPMGSDLRLMSSILQLNTTLERTGDQCANIAKLAKLAVGLPRREVMVDHIKEMGALVRPMIRTASAAYVRRDAEEARLLPAMDAPVNRINRLMFRQVVECGSDPKLLEWATHIMMAARALERIGDQAVDIGEQVVFLATGEFQEFESLKGPE